jgi:hypothetical protein
VQEVGRELQEKEQDYSYAGNRQWLQAHPTSHKCVPRLKSQEVDLQTQGDYKEGRKSWGTGDWKACRRILKLWGGC